jgi:hypothetical protein
MHLWGRVIIKRAFIFVPYSFLLVKSEIIIDVIHHAILLIFLILFLNQSSVYWYSDVNFVSLILQVRSMLYDDEARVGQVQHHLRT